MSKENFQPLGMKNVFAFIDLGCWAIMAGFTSLYVGTTLKMHTINGRSDTRRIGSLHQSRQGGIYR